MAVHPEWVIDVAVLHRYPKPIPTYRTRAASMSGALRGLDRHLKAHGVTWRVKDQSLRVVVTRLGVGEGDPAET